MKLPEIYINSSNIILPNFPVFPFWLFLISLHKIVLIPFVKSLKSLETTGPTETTGTNTLPVSNIGIVNLEQKKKPHDINIKNYNPNEPKIKSNIKYSGKQSFRGYKTKTEPNLHNKIEINEDDDIVNKLKKHSDQNQIKKILILQML